MVMENFWTVSWLTWKPLNKDEKSDSISHYYVFIKRNFVLGSEKITKGCNFAIKFAENRGIRMNLKSILASMNLSFETKVVIL